MDFSSDSQDSDSIQIEEN